MSTFIAGKMEKLKLRETKLLAEVGLLAEPERDHLMEIKTKIKMLSNSLTSCSVDETNSLDKVFLDRHSDLSKVIKLVSNWGEKKFKFDATTGGSIEMAINNENRKTSESEGVVDIRKHSYKVKLMWNKCPHPMGVAESPWKDELVNDHLIYIAGSDSKMIIGIDR